MGRGHPRGGCRGGSGPSQLVARGQGATERQLGSRWPRAGSWSGPEPTRPWSGWPPANEVELFLHSSGGSAWQAALHPDSSFTASQLRPPTTSAAATRAVDLALSRHFRRAVHPPSGPTVRGRGQPSRAEPSWTDRSRAPTSPIWRRSRGAERRAKRPLRDFAPALDTSRSATPSTYPRTDGG